MSQLDDLYYQKQQLLEKIRQLSAEISTKYDLVNSMSGSAVWARNERSRLYQEISNLKYEKEGYKTELEGVKQEIDRIKAERGGRGGREGQGYGEFRDFGRPGRDY